MLVKKIKILHLKFLRRITWCARENYRELVLSYSEAELKLSAIYCVLEASSVIFVGSGLVILFPNSFYLPMNFYIFFLPFEGFSASWALNYLYQFADNICSMIFFLGYFCMTLIFMNHSCLVIDAAVLSVRELEEALSHNGIRNCDVRSALKQVIEESCSIISWMNDARRMMRLSLLADFSMLSSILCMCIVTFISNPSGSVFALLLTVIALSQLSVNCWMGSRVDSKIQKFSTAIYNVRWDKMQTKQQKDLQLLLMMPQNIKGFDAVFNSVDLRSFQNVN